jgi:hypothetical protein
MALFITCAAAFILFRWNLSRHADKALDAIRAQGYPVTLEELEAWYVEPPAGENAADLLLPALFQFAELPEESRPFVPLFGCDREGQEVKPPHHSEPMPPEMKEHTWGFLAANRESIRIFHEAADMAKCRWPIDLQEGAMMPLPHVGRFRPGARLLALEALLHAENGDGELAGQSLIAAIGLARSLAKEPVYMSQHVRVACLGITVKALERTLNKAALPEEQMARLTAEFADAENPEYMARGLAGDLCTALNSSRYVVTELLSDPERSGFPLSKSAAEFLRWTYEPLGFSDVDTVRWLQIRSLEIEAASQPNGKRQPAMARVAEVADNVPWYCPLSSISQHFRPDVMDRIAAQLRAARLALAVERYRAAHGDLPEAAGALVPEFIDSLPIDPYSGEPIRYKSLPDGYVVYSIAKNGIDDGGAESETTKDAWEQGDLTFTVERE